jgi:hypothetical protein
MIFKGECEAWKIRNTNTRGGQETWKDKEIRGRHVWNSTTNYDVQYRTYEERVKVTKIICRGCPAGTMT